MIGATVSLPAVGYRLSVQHYHSQSVTDRCKLLMLQPLLDRCGQHKSAQCIVWISFNNHIARVTLHY
jgi:hypothetical protein